LEGGHTLVIPGNSRRVGVLVGVKMKKNKYGIGFSLTNTSAGDVFEFTPDTSPISVTPSW